MHTNIFKTYLYRRIASKIQNYIILPYIQYFKFDISLIDTYIKLYIYLYNEIVITPTSTLFTIFLFCLTAFYYRKINTDCVTNDTSNKFYSSRRYQPSSFSSYDKQSKQCT